MRTHNEKKSAYYRLKRRIDPEYRERERKYQSEYGKQDSKELREKVLLAYGYCCACCGNTYKEFLTIDHIDGRGVHFGHDSQSMYRFLVKNDFPTDNYRLLCMNCNFSLGKYGYCPHSR